MSAARNILAVDLGAESGRVVLCRWTGEEGRLEEIHRFPNGPHTEDGHLAWDTERLWQEILRGAREGAVRTGGRIDSIGVDGWGVDYVLLDRAGNRVGRTYCYRDARNLPAMERAFTRLPKKRIYEITGVQFLPFNTLFQLLAHREEFPAEWDRASVWLTIHDYFQFRLSGVAVAEYTDASTTQLLEVFSRSWSQELAGAFDFDLAKFAPLVQPGTVLGDLRRELAEEAGLKGTRVIAPACHDTGSAVAGIPFPHDDLAFISSGTWSLVGTVLKEPVVSEEACRKKFTNEGGVGGTIRFLSNVVGLWLLQECLREWNAQGFAWTAAQLAERCTEISCDGVSFVIDDTRFLLPGNMLSRINAVLKEQGFGEETRPVELASIIFRSLARRYAEVLGAAQTITGKKLNRVCIVGGGVKNETLNRLTGEASDLEVVRGPSEATAAGNAAVQIAALEKAGCSALEILEISKKLKFISPWR